MRARLPTPTKINFIVCYLLLVESLFESSYSSATHFYDSIIVGQKQLVYHSSKVDGDKLFPISRTVERGN